MVHNGNVQNGWNLERKKKQNIISTINPDAGKGRTLFSLLEIKQKIQLNIAIQTILN